jgi:hypothetical protein
MMNRTSRLLLFISFALAVSFLCLNPAGVQAQTLYGTIAGQVQDQQGAGIGKAEVTVRNVETGATRKVNANDSGAYQVTSIQPGTYEVSASIAGFKTEVRSGINVTVGAEVTVNMSLTVGAVSEKVEVTAEAGQVDTSSATLGGFVNSSTIRELPLNGRDWISLSLLQPGVSPNASQNQNDLSRAQRGNGLSLYIGGGRHTDNLFRIDGVSVNDYANGGPGSALRVNMGVDAIREFSVLTSTYSAEYGRGAGGVVNAITKSGTNDIHGGAYYFHRNSALDARNFFDKTTDPPAFRRHQFGGYVGGRIKKDKTFYFGNYEQLTEIKGLSANDPTLSADAQKGLLCANTACTAKTQVVVSPATKPYISLFPFPTAPTTGDTGFFSFAPNRNGREKYLTSKLDHYFSEATTFFMTYTWDDTFVGAPDNYGLKDTFALSTRQYAVMSLQHIFSPTLINNARAGVSRFLGGNAIDGNAHDKRLEDPAYGFVPGNPFGQIIVNGVSSGTSTGVLNGLQSSGQNYFGYTSPQFYDDVSWTKGRHTIKFGANLEHILYNINEPNKPNGGWIFSSIKDFVTNDTARSTGTNFNSDFPGTDTFRSERTSIFGAYIQDDFRMKSNLTINMGLRYEMATMVDEVHNRIANLQRLTDPSVTVGRPYYNAPKGKNFSPRIGFAWDPFKDGKTSIRGGAGLFDVLILPYMFTARYPRSAPFYKGGQVDGPPNGTFPNNGLPLLSATTLLASHVEMNPSRPYRMQWNMSIQRQLTRSIALTLGYSGSSGVHIIHQEEDTNEVPVATFNTAQDSYNFPLVALNPNKKAQVINPNYGNIRASDWSGHSTYHGFQANLVQRPVKGLSYQIAYTYSKSIDNGSGVFQAGNESFNTAAASWAFDPRINRGVSDFDIPHNFVLNFQYDIPTAEFAKNSAIGKTVLGGWQIGGIYTRQTGAPFTYRIGADRAGTGNHQITASNGAQRPQLLGNLPGCSSPTTGNIDDYILKSCFQFPALGQLGNEGRNIMRVPTFRNLDFTLFKNQNLMGEKLKAQFRVEMFNILNNSNMTAQMLSIFDGAGLIPNAIGKPLAPTANAARTIQLGLRLVF